MPDEVGADAKLADIEIRYKDVRTAEEFSVVDVADWIQEENGEAAP